MLKSLSNKSCNRWDSVWEDSLWGGQRFPSCSQWSLSKASEAWTALKSITDATNALSYLVSLFSPPLSRSTWCQISHDKCTKCKWYVFRRQMKPAVFPFFMSEKISANIKMTRSFVFNLLMWNWAKNTIPKSSTLSHYLTNVKLEAGLSVFCLKKKDIIHIVWNQNGQWILKTLQPAMKSLQMQLPRYAKRYSLIL